MIIVQNKKDCCGCGACVQACRRHCISMQSDGEGFLYPKVDDQACINCGLCEKVCPILNKQEKREPLMVYAAKNRDGNIVGQSSSGGVFSHVATQIINKGGVVFGARFADDWSVIHDYAETLDGVRPFMSSKYVQSIIGDAYSKVKKFLVEGRLVLFTGTPCQVAGLISYLSKPYDNLFTMDFLCHGVPSPLVWHRYLEHEVYKRRKYNSSKSLISDVCFREKSNGWKDFRLVIRFADIDEKEKSNAVFSYHHKENSYMKGFLKNLYLRPSCYQCCFKRFQSHSDLTIADFWAISRVRPDFYDRSGVSMVFINTHRADNFFYESGLDLVEVEYGDTMSNHGLRENTPCHPKRDYFFRHFDANANVEKLILKCVDEVFVIRMLKKFRNVVKRLVK